ncbi:hypothetical protein GF377_05380, partial [candidate division GN15 bacterium]|nr:hypothetical protein [candidate division GN15 bacterium]
MTSRHAFGRVSAVCLMALLALLTAAFADEPTEYWYAMEQDGTVCGYAHVVVRSTEYEGREALQVLDSMWMKIKAMGKSIEGTYVFTFAIDPDTRQYMHHTSKIDQAGMHLGGVTTVRGDSVIMVSDTEPDTTVAVVPEGTLFQNTRFHRPLLDFFVNDTLTDIECPVFSEIDGEAQTCRFTSKGMSEIELAGTTYEALEVHSINKVNGIGATMWIDSKTGLLLKTHHPMRRSYLTDAGVVDRIQEAGHDKHIFAQVDTVIANPWAISSMKVRAKLQPGGMWLTHDGLNVGGQTFTGTIEDNKLDGVFEISYDRYFGENAPPFPCDFSDVDSLQPYLEPSELIESDDSVLICKARQLTEGAADAWESMTRLSQWVNEEISYDLPGGVTARKTYDTRLGECGSHANLLTAFCRAVGIPARGVFGCMYVPNHGGAFGQHAWNEIYMGEENGWIPIDCTADQVTYADCGHIRLGEWTS